MDKPRVERIEAFAVGASIRPIRCHLRSTVGTMTELNDHLKLLYARPYFTAEVAAVRCGATRYQRSRT